MWLWYCDCSCEPDSARFNTLWLQLWASANVILIVRLQLWTWANMILRVRLQLWSWNRLGLAALLGLNFPFNDTFHRRVLLRHGGGMRIDWKLVILCRMDDTVLPSRYIYKRCFSTHEWKSPKIIDHPPWQVSFLDTYILSVYHLTMTCQCDIFLTYINDRWWVATMTFDIMLVVRIFVV